MNDTQIDDLKQFIEATVSQSTQSLGNRLDKRIDILTVEVRHLRKDMVEGFNTIGDAITSIHDVLADHESRIVKLEQRPV